MLAGEFLLTINSITTLGNTFEVLEQVGGAGNGLSREAGQLETFDKGFFLGVLGEHRFAWGRGVQVKGNAEIDGEAERVRAVLNGEHDALVAHDGSQAAGLTGFLGNLLEIGSGDRNNALTGGDGSHRKIKNALGELVALVLLIAGEITELTQGAADAEDRVLGEAGQLDQLSEGAALVGLTDVFHDDEGTLQVRDGVVGFGWHDWICSPLALLAGARRPLDWRLATRAWGELLISSCAILRNPRHSRG